MGDSSFGLDEAATIDKRVDVESLTVGVTTVMRQRMQLAGAAALELARVLNGTPASGDYALLMRQIGLWTPNGESVIDDALDAVKVSLVGDLEPLTAHLVTAATTNATSVKASAAKLRSVHVFNNSGAELFVKFHNTAVAPTPGTGVVFTVGVQAGTARDLVLPGRGRSFATGLGMTVTGVGTDADTTAVVAGSVIEVSYE